MSNIQDAVFAVQRGGTLYKCAGRDLASKLQGSDLLVMQDSDGKIKNFTKNDEQYLNPDMSSGERDWEVLKPDLGLQPTNAEYIKKFDIFYGGEYNWTLTGEGRNIVVKNGNIDGNKGISQWSGVGQTFDPQNDILVTTGWVTSTDQCFNKCISIPEFLQVSGFPYDQSSPHLFTGAGCCPVEGGETIYFHFHRPNEGANSREIQSLYIYKNYQDFFETHRTQDSTFAKATKHTLPFKITKDVKGFVVDEKSKLIYMYEDCYQARVFKIDLSNPNNSCVMSGYYEKGMDLDIMNGYWYLLTKDRKIHWGQVGGGSTAVSTFSLPADAGGHDWGWYAPDTYSMSGNGTEMFIGAAKGSLLTVKMHNYNPSSWTYSQQILTDPDGAPFLFMSMASDGKGTYFAPCKDYYVISEVQPILIPCTATNGVTYTVTGGDFHELL